MSRNVRRSLFGPVDHVENKKYIDMLQQKFDEEAKNRWGFDFSANQPVKNSQYDWSLLHEGEFVPSAYDHMVVNTCSQSATTSVNKGSADPEPALEAHVFANTSSGTDENASQSTTSDVGLSSHVPQSDADISCIVHPESTTNLLSDKTEPAPSNDGSM